MTPNDEGRYALYARLQEVVGTAEADYLMTHLPRDPSDEVATKSDIARLDNRFDHLERRFDRFEDRLDRLNATIVDQQKFYARTTVWSMVGLTAIFSFVVTFFG